MLIEELMYNPYVWLIISLSTIFAFGFAIYTWVVGKKRKEIAFYQSSTCLVEEGKSLVSELKLLYKDREVENLTITKLAIWNSGNEVINGEDIVTVKPLEVIVNDEKTDILDVKIIRQSDDTNMFIFAKKEQKKVELKFDYLNSADGIVAQFLHTGKSSALILQGKIKGGKELKDKNKQNAKFKMPKRIVKKVIIVLSGIEVLMLLVMSIISILITWDLIPDTILKLQVPVNPVMSNIIMSIIMLMGVIVVSFMYYRMLKKTYYIDIPKSLRKGFIDDKEISETNQDESEENK